MANQAAFGDREMAEKARARDVSFDPGTREGGGQSAVRAGDTSYSRETYIAAFALAGVLLHPVLQYLFKTSPSISRLPLLATLIVGGLPLLVGLSRKRFINSVSPSKPDERLGGSIAGNVLAALAGADIMRVHDVAETVQALRLVAAIQAAQ